MIEGGGLGFYLLLGLLFLVFLYSTRRATRRPPLGGEPGEEEALQAPPIGTDWGRAPSEAPLRNEVLEAIEALEAARPAREPLPEAVRDARRPARGALPTQPPGAGRPARTRRMLDSRRGLRDAMALMAVLGPCRALSPYDASAVPPEPLQARPPAGLGAPPRAGAWAAASASPGARRPGGRSTAQAPGGPGRFRV